MTRPSPSFSRFCFRGGIFLLMLAVVAETRAGVGPLLFQPGGQLGPCSVEQWKKDWPGCGWEDGVQKGRLSIVERGGVKRFRVDYAPGEIGPADNGIGWRCPIGQREKAEMVYTLRFGKDFEWVKGGKLPGLCGGPENVSGGKAANGTNGFSARLMWRAGGRGEAYVYHKNQAGTYGDSFAFPDDVRFPTETDIRVRLRVEMNTAGLKNGKLSVWIALKGPQSEQLVVERTDMEWRNAETFGVDSMFFETFYGGGDKTWAPSRLGWTEFGDLSIRE